MNDKGRYHSRWNTPKRLRLFPSKDRGIWRAVTARPPVGLGTCFFGQVQADAEDPLELFRYRWYNSTIEEAFRAAFEAGIASDLDVEKAWKKFQKA
jgi:hypothetical protein